MAITHRTGPSNSLCEIMLSVSISEIDQSLWIFGGSTGALALAGAVAASALYLVITKPRPTKPLIPLHDQSEVLPGPELVRASKLHKGSKYGQVLTFLYDDVRTLYESFLRGAKESNNGNCLGWREGPHKPYTWQSYNEIVLRAKNFGSGLLCLGLAPGQSTNVGIYSKNRPEWIVTEQAAYCYSMVVVPLYDTLGAEACKFIINQTEMAVVICEDEEKAKRLLDQSLQHLKTLVMINEVSSSTYEKANSQGIKIVKFGDVENQGEQADHPIMPPKADDLCTICYTSGTTGVPKGVMLTHLNLLSCVNSAMVHFKEFSPSKDDVMISILPLAHVYERFYQHTVYMAGGAVGFFGGDIQKLGEDLAAVKPTIMIVVPRLINKVYDKTQVEISKSKIKKVLFNMALSSKESDMKKGIIRNNSIWDKIVFRKVREAMGGRLRFMIVGAAPLSGKVLTFARCAFGCQVVEGYGQTECSGPCACAFVGDRELEHVGPPIACSKIKLVDVPEMEYYAEQNRGEIYVQGANVFKGYYKDPEKTKEAMDEEGWLHTGDIGEWSANNTLKIIDRRKHIFKLSQGEYVAPEKIENIYIGSKYVEQVFVHGESLKSCTVAIVVPIQDVIISWAADQGIEGNFPSLCKDARVKQMIKEDILRLGAVAGLKTFEQVKDIYLHSDPFSIQNGLLTPTMKTKRPEIMRLFQQQIHDMYKNLV